MKTLVSDCLTNCCVDCIRSFENSSMADDSKGIVYGKGIINGMVSILMSQGMPFADALSFVKSRTIDAGPHGRFDVNCVPNAWRDDWRKAPCHQP